MKGFFAETDLTRNRIAIPLVAQCGACQLFKGCQSPKMKVQGEGRKKILIVAESPSKSDDERGVHLTGSAGDRLWGSLNKVGIKRRDCWTTGSIICHPKNKYNLKAIEHCRPNLINTLNELKPEKILVLGGSAVQSLIGWLWKDKPGEVGRWVGWHIPAQRINAWVCPTWHPNYILQIEKSGIRSAVAGVFQRHIELFAAVEGRPWEKIPDFEKQVEVVIDPGQAAEKLIHFRRWSEECSFDYETNMLKPDSDRARIVTCAVSNGEWTLAYPWTRATAKATGDILFSKIPKDGWNIKFEDRWTRKEFGGRRVRNWRHDGMITSHILDCRRGITSCKFQGFVVQGQESWDDIVHPYLEGQGGNGENRIKEVNLPALLKYNGLDALMEHRIGKIQREKMRRLLKEG